MSWLTLISGRGRRNPAGITSEGRLLVDAINEDGAAASSRLGNLWGLGTGFLTIPAAIGASSPILWFKNATTDEDWHIVKLIGGHTGSQSNPTHNVALGTLIKYQAAEPSANNTAVYATIENISRSVIDTSASETTGTRKSGFEGYKWNESGTAGMTTGAGGFYQIPNCWRIGHTEPAIGQQIILGPGDSMQFDIMNTNLATSDTMEFQLSVVFETTNTGEPRSGSLD